MTPVRSSFTPSARSTAWSPHSPFGMPDAYSQQNWSRISQPASSMAQASRCQVRGEPNTRANAPGRTMPSMAVQNSGSKAMPVESQRFTSPAVPRPSS